MQAYSSPSQKQVNTVGVTIPGEATDSMQTLTTSGLNTLLHCGGVLAQQSCLYLYRYITYVTFDHY